MPKSAPHEVHTITEAQRALSDEQVGRQRRYLISMSIRTVCFLLVVFVPGWPKVVFAIGAVALPYLAVVAANAGRENDEPGQVGVPAQARPELPSAPARVIDDGEHRTP